MEAIIVAVAQLVDDAQTDRRDPSHSDLEFHIKRSRPRHLDPHSQDQKVGKAKSIRSTLIWALENDPESGGELVASLIGLIRGHGGFRKSSANYVGKEAIENAIAVFDAEGMKEPLMETSDQNF